MELEEMKVTIDRLETEKQDLYEEIRETKVNIFQYVIETD